MNSTPNPQPAMSQDEAKRRLIANGSDVDAMIAMAGGVRRGVTLRAPDFRPDPDELRAAMVAYDVSSMHAALDRVLADLRTRLDTGGAPL